MITPGSGNPAEDVATAVANAAQAGERVIDKISYRQSDNTLQIECGALSLSIKINSIPELSGIPADEMQLIELPPGGTTIELEKLNIYIEGATVVLDEIHRLLGRKDSGGLILDSLKRNRRIG
jgi:hypothetical protein